MKMWQIESKAGDVYGQYEGATAADAFAAMIDDAGSSDGAEGAAADWIIREVRAA